MNAVNAQEGQESISSVLGPMTNTISGLKRFTKAILDAKPWNRDPLVVRKPWNWKEYELEEHGHGVGMCFAIMWDNGVVKPHPPLIRAMEITKAALEAAGHKGKRPDRFGLLVIHSIFSAVIDWVPHRHMDIYRNAVCQVSRPIISWHLYLFRNRYSLLTAAMTTGRNAKSLASR